MKLWKALKQKAVTTTALLFAVVAVGAFAYEQIELSPGGPPFEPDVFVATHAELAAEINAAPMDGTRRVIGLTADIAAGGQINISEGRNIVLMSYGGRRTHRQTAASSNHRHFAVTFGSKFTIYDITLDGTHQTGGANRGGVAVIDGNFVMEEGSVITNVRWQGANGTPNASGWAYTAPGRGRHQYGGAVRVEGTQGLFTMRAGEISYSLAVGGTGAESTVNQSASRGSGGIAGGGGVAVLGGATFRMEGGEIRGNRAIGGNGANNSVNNNTHLSGHGGDGRGGGVFVGAGFFHATGGHIHQNVAHGGTGGRSWGARASRALSGGHGDGGGVFAGARHFHIDWAGSVNALMSPAQTAPVEVVLQNVIIEGNATWMGTIRDSDADIVGPNPVWSLGGGGLAASGGPVAVTLIDSVVSGNSVSGVVNGAVPVNRTAGRSNHIVGGGILVSQGASVTLVNSEVIENQLAGVAGRSGGGTANGAQGSNANGGGIHVESADSEFTMTGGAIRGNLAQGGAGGNKNGGTTGAPGAAGNAIGGAISQNAGTVTLTDVVIEDNMAIAGSGGHRTHANTGAGNAGNGGWASGGGIDTRGGSAYLENVTIQGNVGEGGAGGVRVNASQGNGGAGIGAAGGGLWISGSPVSIVGGVIQENRVYGGTGGHRASVTAGVAAAGSATGAGIETANGATLTIDGTVISANQSTPGSQSNGVLSIVNNGGGINVVSGSRVTMLDGEIRDNIMARRGGGVNVNDANSRFTLEGGTISGNRVNHTGGGVDVHSADGFVMNGGVITDNYAPFGGGVYTWARNGFTMNGGVIEGNRAPDGAGVFVYSVPNAFIMNDGVIEGNQAQQGGGVFISTASSFIMNDGIIKENQADRGAGVHVAVVNGFVMHDGTIEANHAIDGGGIFARSVNNAVTINAGTLRGNIAENDGGAIFTERYQHGSRVLANAAAYNNLIIGEEVVFEDNESFFSFEVPINVEEFLPNIQSRNATVHEHPLNNYDINFRGVLFTATFHAYDGSDDAIVVPLLYGQPITPPNMGAIDERGWEVWGWFTEEQLDESGRTSPETGLRRPQLAEQGFALWERFFFEEEGNMDLFTIWRRWGDVNGDDVVDEEDLDYLREYMIRQTPNGFMRGAAYVTRGSSISVEDFGRLQRYLAGISGNVLGIQ